MSVLRQACVLFSLAPLPLALSEAAHADETFLCEDGTSVTVTSASREAMQNHPCVKQWFTNEAETRAAKAAATEEKPTGNGYAGGVARGAALAALTAQTGRQQPSSQSRTVRVHIHRPDAKGSADTQKGTSRRLFRLRRR